MWKEHLLKMLLSINIYIYKKLNYIKNTIIQLADWGLVYNNLFLPIRINLVHQYICLSNNIYMYYSFHKT